MTLTTSLLRLWTEQKRSKEAVCFTGAIIAHLVFFATISIANPYGAVGEGDSGFEVGLGMLTPTPVDPVVPEPEPPHRDFVQPVVEIQPPIPDVQRPEVVVEEVHFHVHQPVVEHEPIDIDSWLENINVASPLPPSEVSVGTGSQDSFGGVRGMQSSYAALVATRLNRFKRYPSQSREDGHEGVVTLSLEIERDGTVSSSAIRRSSGFTLLDEAALTMVNRAQPFPAFPRQLTQNSLLFDMPVTFTIDDK